MSEPIPEPGTITIKFLDSLELPHTTDMQAHLNHPALGPLLSSLVAAIPGLQLHPWDASVDPADLRRLMDQARANDQNYVPANLLNFF